MYVVLLKFAENKSRAGDYMQDHNAWIKQGLDDGVFLLVGSLPFDTAEEAAPSAANGSTSPREP